MWWTIPLVLLWVFLWVGIPMIIEMRAEKKHHRLLQENNNKLEIKKGDTFMRIDVKEEQKKFWKVFDEKLIENGEPFSILHEKSGEVTNWAVINKNHSFVDNALSVDILVREQKLRINIYVRNDLALFSIFERHKKEIESRVNVPLKWVNGTKNPNTRRIIYEVPIQTGYWSNYDEIIDDILPIVIKMKKVCETYARNDFFDM